MARLPEPGGDDGSWGTLLNDFLLYQHNDDGTHKLSLNDINDVSTAGAADGDVLAYDGGSWEATTAGNTDPSMGGDLSGAASNAQIVSGAVGTSELADGAVTNENVSATAAIEQSKIADLQDTLSAKAALDHTHDISEITDLQDELDNKLDESALGQPDGIATLGSDGKVPSTQLSADITTKLLPYSHFGNLLIRTGSFKLYNDSASDWTITAVRASVGIAPEGSSVIVDLNINGTTIFTNQANRPTIPPGVDTSGKVTNMDITKVEPGQYMTLDIDQVGSVTPGGDLTVQIGVT